MAAYPFFACFVFFALFAFSVGGTQLLDGKVMNDRPVIGILSVPTVWYGDKEIEELGESYINSAYVKWIESSGARVAPILYDAPEEEISSLAHQLSGILFTGGNIIFKLNPDDQEHIISPKQKKAAKVYFNAAKLLFEHALEENNQGRHFPLWGTCMGFQVMSVIAANSFDVLQVFSFDTINTTLPLHFLPGAFHSKLLRYMPGAMRTWLKTLPLTVNLHHDGIDPADYKDVEALSQFQVLSWNKDGADKPFASMIESKRYPFFGVQFHPERPSFEWTQNEANNHSEEAIQAMRYFADVFVSHSRLCENRFVSLDKEKSALIYNHLPVHLPNAYDHLVYTFPSFSK